jgi:uncharacterized surface protein with fasciclin (FAS1) repeats
MKIQRRTLLLGSALGAATTFLAACGGGNDDKQPLGNIVEVAQGNSSFSVLVEAVVAAGLVSTLSGSGPFTVFAPTNDAFVALLDELKISKEALLANTELLTAVLTYHVVPGKVESASVASLLGKPITTVQGDIFKIESEGSALKITDGRNRTAGITGTDIQASNGVIHVIDRVILPADKNIVQTAIAASPEFSILVEAVVAAGLAETLSGPGPFTVFAPTDAAFAAALTELNLTKEQLLDSPLLGDVLKYHVVSGRVLKAEVPVGVDIPTLLGMTETFRIGNTLAITDEAGRVSNIAATDVLTSNGVIHVVDRVILPSAFAPI